MSKHAPVVLCILDGWGHREETDHNAIALANTPNWDDLLKTYPHTVLDASEGSVGLPSGQMGNSEVGHMNIGAGRIVMQDLPRIDAAIEAGEFAANPTLKAHIAALKASGGTCHLMGLLSDGGVHAHIRHIIALAKTVAAEAVPVSVHAFLDGRDTPPQSAKQYLQQLEEAIKDEPTIQIATICGRYYAMDRDKRWERVQKAYEMLLNGTGHQSETVKAAIAHAYEAEETTDEFVTPHILPNYTGMQDGDGLLMANFRADRARELLSALLDPGFDDFPRSKVVSFATAMGMVEYSDTLNNFLETLFPKTSIKQGIGEVVSDAGLKQLRLAETEKYAHVTFFMNGGVEALFDGEERILIPSPNVATYDLQPEMAAHEVTDALVHAIASDEFALIIVNYANPDMVGHTGNLEASIKAVETIDHCLGRIRDAVEETSASALITADHGNIECLYDASSDQAHTAHTTNIVPALCIRKDWQNQNITLRPKGKLADVAPTLLQWLKLGQPDEMTGTPITSE